LHFGLLIDGVVFLRHIVIMYVYGFQCYNWLKVGLGLGLGLD